MPTWQILCPSPASLALRPTRNTGVILPRFDHPIDEYDTILEVHFQKPNAVRRMNRLSLKKKSSFRPPRSSDAPLASPSPGSSSAAVPVPEGGATVPSKQLDPAPAANAGSGAREVGGGSTYGKDTNGCNEAGPSASRGTTAAQPIPSRRPALLTGTGARFKPPGMLGAGASGSGSNPLPPPGWKPRKKDLASFDMLDDLPDLAAVAPQTSCGAAAAALTSVEPGAAVENGAGTDRLSEQQAGCDRNWQRKPFVPPRPQGMAGPGGLPGVSRVADGSQAGIASNDHHQATVPETSAQPALDKAGDATQPLDSHRDVAGPSNNARETAPGNNTNGAGTTTNRRHTLEASEQGTSQSNADELPQQQQQQHRLWQQSINGTDDGRPGECMWSAGATLNAGRADQGWKGPAGSDRLETPGNAAAVSEPSGLRRREPMQTAGRSTERRRHLKRLYSGDPQDDLLPDATTSRPASQDEVAIPSLISLLNIEVRTTPDDACNSIVFYHAFIAPTLSMSAPACLPNVSLVQHEITKLMLTGL